MSKKLGSFVKEVMARLQGDDDKVVAERNYRLANAAVKGQLSSLDGKQVEAEVTLESAKEKLNSAKYPTTLISNSSDYIRSISRAQDQVDEAQEELNNVNSSIEYFKGLYEEFNPKG